ncbi:MAG: hypothetical protein QM516_00200, partial [Limnohabitans sp.]|nr:hypothetical protein [Limnohabitans sp.]
TASPTVELSREEGDLRQKRHRLLQRIRFTLSYAATPEEKARWIKRLQIQPIHELLEMNDRGAWNPTFEELRRIDEVLQGIERVKSLEGSIEGITIDCPPSPNDASFFSVCAGSLLSLIFWIWLFRAIRGRGGSGHGGPQSPPLQALAGAHSPQGRRSTGSGSGLPDTLRITDDKH